MLAMWECVWHVGERVTRGSNVGVGERVTRASNVGVCILKFVVSAADSWQGIQGCNHR